MYRAFKSWQGALLLTAATLTSQTYADYAAGPSAVARADRHLWTEPLSSGAGFDKGSRAAIIIYMQTLQQMQAQSDAQMITMFKIKSLNRASVDKWTAKELKQSTRNYTLAAKTCAVTALNNDWTCLGAEALKGLNHSTFKTPTTLSAWQDNTQQFATLYIAEQMRLAALFPKVSSEIDVFNSNEFTGDNVPDKTFYLTFDDGPTAARGSTDDVLQMLNSQKKSATFFVLGQNFQNRVASTSPTALSTRYAAQCVALHGWEHQSHAKWDTWQDSVKHTQSLVATTLPAQNVSPLFRPPYGQRKSDSNSFFAAQHLKVALWNLDSQDWNTKVSIDDIINRMTLLMLIKRHGILLFHDIHPKAYIALPEIFNNVGAAVTWGDCHTLVGE